MKVSYIGNHDPPWSTETHISKALENLGHEVQRIPEQRLEWLDLPDLVEGDLLLWTRTAGFDPPDHERQATAIKAVSVPVVGYHLDRWWGLKREATERGPRAPDASPWFWATDLICTADGGHQAQWEGLGIRHYWFPPAILTDETVPGSYDKKYAYDVAFVGNLTDYGHAEWREYRHRLFMELRTRYRGRFMVFPGRGRPQIRGRELANLYASAKVLIGDSCLAGDIGYYWSDRIPETCGRGGFLIHPRVDGLEDAYPELVTYGLGNFDELAALIDDALADPVYRESNAELNRTRTLEAHTYEERMDKLLAML